MIKLNVLLCLISYMRFLCQAGCFCLCCCSSVS